MGNLLSYKPSFVWEDLTIDRGEFIQSLNAALITARDYKDKIYCTPDFKNIKPSWGDFLEFLYCTAYDDAQREIRMPWLSQIQHQTLVNIFAFLKNESPNSSNTLAELNAEFRGANNSYIGIQDLGNPHHTVSCESSWWEFHKKYVSNMSHTQRSENYDYFYKFFTPGLTIAANQINDLIRRGLTPVCFDRIDMPKFAHDKVHIHFTDGTALNIDGGWRHPSSVIPIPARDTLAQWGFRLPQDHY